MSTLRKVNMQRWSPRGRPWPRKRPRRHILKYLALASKIKSLASKPQVFENCHVLGSRTALFFVLLKVCGAPQKAFGKRFFLVIAWKFFLKTFFYSFFFWDRRKIFSEAFFFRALVLVSLVSSIPVLGLERVCPRQGCSWSWIFLCPWSWPRALCPRLHLC